MDAFASFRTRQLQASRLSFMDLSGSKENNLEFEGTNFSGYRSVTHSFLEDLHVVSLMCVPYTKNFSFCI